MDSRPAALIPPPVSDEPNPTQRAPSQRATKIELPPGVAADQASTTAPVASRARLGAPRLLASSGPFAGEGSVVHAPDNHWRTRSSLPMPLRNPSSHATITRPSGDAT